MGKYEKLLSRDQCPVCFGDLELTGLMDESAWDSMSIPERVVLCTQAGISGKHGSKSYDDLGKLTYEELSAICDYTCLSCGTSWPAVDLLPAIQTPNQLEIYMREHRRNDG